MSFTTPLGLVLLIALPIVIYLGWPRLPYRRRRDITSLILRVVILLLLVFSLAGVQTVQSADRLAVVFLLDVSDSMTARARESGLDYIRQALATMQPDDRAALVLFGGSALVERPLSSVRELPVIQSAPPSGSTDLEEAIRLALGMFPADAARRIVILSDGRETIGKAASAAELAAATGVEISYVLYRPDNLLEVQVTEVTVPAAINAGQTFDLSLTIHSETATPANITVLESGQIIHREAVDLRQGPNRYTLTLQAVGSGFKDFQVQVDPAGSDSFYQNNQLSAFSRVVGPPRVLVLYTDPLEITYLLPALQQAGLSIDTATPEQLPVGLVPLAQYESIVMVDVPATALTPQRMDAIQSFVRDLGGGLVAIGGPQSYGPGGYFQTPLEETLPLDSQVKDQQRLPQLTIAYVIDRSGSMGTVGPSGVENIELAKEAIIRSVDFLQPTDRAGVVSFDTIGYWIANVQEVRDRVGLQRLVATLRTGGGTDILAGMNIIAPVMAEDPSTRKHIILLTDGGANPEGLVELTTQLNTQAGVTTSVIAIGAGAAPFLEDMAKTGGGNYHPVERVEQIPTIFSQETVLATRSYILEDPFVPILTATSPILDGIANAPQLLGYVATSPKQTAQVILSGPEPYRDPLLAAWQYGLGRSVAFTSDATARWGVNWISWDNYVRFWNQTIRWTITEGTSGSIESQVVMDGERARLVVDARDDDGGFLNGLNLQLSLVDPAGQPALINLRQVAPGRYEAVFTPEQEGAYLLALRGSSADSALTVDQTTGWVMSYSAEYDRTSAVDGAAVLQDVAELTGGISVQDSPDLSFNHNLRSVPSGTPLAPWLLLIALLLLPVDIAVRRLIITTTDIQRLRQWASRRAAVPVASERIAALLQAKQRGRQRAEEPAPSTVSALRARRDRAPAPAPPAEPRPISPTEPPAQSRPSIPPPAASPGGNIAGELLKKRKERRTDE